MSKLLSIFKALSDETRLRIINILFQRNFCVCELQEILEMSEPRVSRHLSILKEAGLVDCEKHGKWCHYHISHNRDNENLFKFLKKSYAKSDTYKLDIEKSNLVKKVCEI